MKVDYEKLRVGLEKLTGYDYIQAENDERRAGNQSVYMPMSSGFCSRLAAVALGMPVPQLQAVGVVEFNNVLNYVISFLNGNLDVGSGVVGSTVE